MREEPFANDQFRFRRLDLSSSVPTDVSACFVRGDVEELARKTLIPMQVGKLPQSLYCIQLNAPPFQDELKQPPMKNTCPSFGSTKRRPIGVSSARLSEAD